MVGSYLAKALTTWSIQNVRLICYHSYNLCISSFASGIRFGLHLADASSLWVQSWIPMPSFEHWNRALSVPLHDTVSRRIGPEPGPNRAEPKA